MLLDHKNHLTHPETPISHFRFVDDGIRRCRVHPVIHAHVDGAIAIGHFQHVIHMDGIAGKFHETGLGHIAGSGVVATITGLKGPDPGIRFPVIVFEHLVQSADAILIPTGINGRVEGADDRSRTILDHATGAQLPLEELTRNQFRGFPLVVVESRPRA